MSSPFSQSIIRVIAILTMASGVVLAEKKDTLRLDDGVLLGKFSGIESGETLLWKRDDSPDPLKFSLKKLRYIALNGGISFESNQKTSRIALHGGDQLSGEIESLDKDFLVFQSKHAGTLKIPVDKIKQISPNPYGGRVLYIGPFSDNGWEIFPKTENEEEKENEKEPSWQFAAAKWYYTGGDQLLRMADVMPGNSILRFRYEWRSRPLLTVGFHADFAAQPDKDGDAKTPTQRGNQLLAGFGNSLILSFRNNYVALQHNGYNEDGTPFSKRLPNNVSNLRLSNDNVMDIELRTNLEEGRAVLFVNGEFFCQWNLNLEGDNQALGAGFGFQMNAEGGQGRISNISVSEWNGMPDAARSFDSSERDTILLTNGMDRFSGAVESIQDDTLHFKSSYAALQIPLREIESIHLAHAEEESQEDDPESTKAGGNTVTLQFIPYGRLHGQLLEATENEVIINSPTLGRLQISLRSAALIELQSSNQFLLDWEENL